MSSVILRYSQDMRPDITPSYRYDLNMVQLSNGDKVPFVDSNKDYLCITTKTETIRESDDSFNEMLMISTKTFSQCESDDQGFTHYE